MRIINYDSVRQTLYVQYSTKTIWEYAKITQHMVDYIYLAGTTKALRDVIKNSNIVGISKGIIQ